MESQEAKRSCGTCSLCCNVLQIDVLNKPANEWCKHVVHGQGCAIYGSHPEVCKAFRCLWLDDANLGAEWKPELCKFVLRYNTSGKGLLIDVDTARPSAWRSEPFYSQIKKWSEITRTGKGYVAVFVGTLAFIVFPEEELAISGLGSKTEISVGYRRHPHGRQPCVLIGAQGVATEHLGRVYSAG